MPLAIKQALEQKKDGFYIGHRLILPFRCQLIKIIAEGEIITEMVGGEEIKIQQDPKNTSIYFRSIGRLENFIQSYRVIKLIVCEWDSELCDINNHIKLICEVKDKHSVAIHLPSDDMLFIE